ncbi:deoxyribose-phosphate aldolase [Muribacter muris]|uniref:Deoxyribose-phosphate aldolase n=1 Tax=Muribacter muris TaxID=67855 RepID=A0A4Y9JYY3_9PAST|nr:deoxyribose-phosphate aldolase [Muribacter muris]MBF0785386.1 deoxyribose-phosphate aldolase [Muribacter muris]MBF0826041.1 deoxyribose-phosphate aldolase [Muribacter muris]TFV09646.1 deoxyribose-phosphate aldolase [Muribacter muris]
MKKLSLVLLMSAIVSACTADVYADKGNATILSSKDLSENVVELVVQKDNGELVTMTREYDAHAAVGARVNVTENYNHEDPDLKTITRYEFK